MTKVRVMCSDCNADTKVEASDMTLYREEDGTFTYVYTCASCDTDVRRYANPRIVVLLDAAGVHVYDRRESTNDSRDHRTIPINRPALCLNYEMSDSGWLVTFEEAVA